MSELTPITSPCRLSSGPPELPGFTATSVWMKGTYISSGSERPFALTMPAVMVLAKPKGEPIAATQSPGSSFEESPSFAVGRSCASTLRSATSLRLSTPITLALNSRLESARRTLTSSTSATTCALVRM